jgi:hypothetical protein
MYAALFGPTVRFVTPDLRIASGSVIGVTVGKRPRRTEFPTRASAVVRRRPGEADQKAAKRVSQLPETYRTESFAGRPVV